MGMPPEAIADLERRQQAADMLIDPDCWPTVRLFLHVQTQWRTDMGHPVGLDYGAVDVVMRRLRIDDPDGELFEGLQVMESAALAVLHEK